MSFHNRIIKGEFSISGGDARAGLQPEGSNGYIIARPRDSGDVVELNDVFHGFSRIL
jgi:hypothetical protein